MGGSISLEKSARVTAAGEMQDLRFAADVGNYRYVSARFKLLSVDGGPTTGMVTIGVRQAAINEAGEYAEVGGSPADLEFTVNYNDPDGSVQFETSESFSRFLAWEVTGFSFDGTDPAVVFSIELILKD